MRRHIPGDVAKTILGGKGRKQFLVGVIILALAIGALLLNSFPFSSRSALASTTTLSILSGEVTVQVAGDTNWRPGRDGMILNAGDRIRTGAGGHALITFFEGSTIELEPETDLTIQVQEAAREGAAITIRLKQWMGTTWSRVVQMADPASRYDIETPAAVATVRGTLFDVTVESDGSTQVKVMEGRVQVASDAGDVSVDAGYETQVTQGQAPQAPVPMPVQRNRILLELHSPVWMLVVDPHGRSVGVVPPGVEVNQVPGARTTPPSEEPQVVELSQIVGGEYRIILYRKEPGSFGFTATGLSGASVVFSYSRQEQVIDSAQLGVNLQVNVSAGDLVGGDLGNFARLDGQSPAKVVLAKPVAERAAQAAGGNAGTGPARLGFETTSSPGAGRTPGSGPSATRVSTSTPNPTRTPGTTPTPASTVTAAPTSISTATPAAVPTLTETPAPASTTPSPTDTPSIGSTPAILPPPISTVTSTPLPPAPTYTPIPTPAPTETATQTPMPTYTPTVMPTNSLTPTATPTGTSTATPTGTSTATPTEMPTSTATPTGTPTATSTVTPTETSTATPTGTATPTPTNTPTPTASPVSLIVNGDFETPVIGGGWQNFGTGANIGGWQVLSGNVDLVKTTYLKAARNSQWIDLSGGTSGAIYQDIATTSGYTYTIRFAMAGNPVGQPDNKVMQVWWGGNMVEVLTFDADDRSGTNMGWEYHTYTLTASSSTTRIEFQSLTPSAYGPGLDDVSVIQTGAPG